MITASALNPDCAYAKVLGAKRPAGDAAARGVTFHAAVETWLHTGEIPALDDAEIQGWLDLLACRLWLPALVNAEAEVAWGLWSDGEYADVDEPMPHVYVAREARGPHRLITAGRADLAYVAGNVLHIFDWKTGRWPAAPAVDNLQVNAAGLALARRVGVPYYLPCVAYVRDGHFDHGEHVEVDGAAGRAMFERVRAAASLPLEPLPGPHCASCWERKGCPGAAGEP